MTADQDCDRRDGWFEFGQQLKLRATCPFHSPAAVWYFLSVILAVNAVSIWLSYSSRGTDVIPSSIPRHIAVTAVGLLTAAAADLVLEADSKTSLRAFWTALLIFGVIAIGFAHTTGSWWSWGAAVGGVTIACFMWWCSTGNRLNLQDRAITPPGGDGPPSGTTEGYQV